MTKKQLFNQQGMTLVEVMIAASLLAGLAVAGMTLFKTQTVGQKTVEANYEVTNLLQQIRTVLSDQQNCTASFTGLNPNSFSAGGSFTLQKRRIGGGYDPVYPLNKNLVGNVKITGYRLERTPNTATNPLATNETWLKIDFSKGKSTLLENTTKMMKVIVSPSPAASNTSITSCYAYNNNSDTYWIQGTPPDIYFTAGHVGIGTTTPGAILDVAEGGVSQCCATATQTPNISMAQASNANSKMAWLQFHNSGEAEAYIRLAGGGAGVRAGQRRIEIGDNQGTLASLTVTGNVGIGTTAPSTGLHVVKSDQSYALFGPNTSSGTLVTGATGNQAGANQAQVVSTNGNLHIDSGTSRNLYLNYYSTQNTFMNALGGNVGIGNTAPTYKLHVTGDIYANGGWLRTSDTAGWYSETWGGGWHMVDGTWVRAYNGKGIYTDGSIGVGTTAGTYKLMVNGDGWFNGWIRTNGNTGWFSETHGGGWFMTDSTWIRAFNNKNVYTAGQIRADGSMQVGGSGEISMVPAAGITSTNGYWYPSDKRLKSDISDLESGLEKILKFRARNFTWKKSGKKDIGFIAQEVQKVDPKLIQETKDKKKTLTVKLEGFFPYIVKAIQELFEMITGVKAEQEKLRLEVVELKKQNKELSARLDRQDEILRRLEKKANSSK